jgi:hypothetical protein
LSFDIIAHTASLQHKKNHIKIKKTPPTVRNAQNLHTVDIYIISKLSVSSTKPSALTAVHSAYAAQSEQKDSEKKKAVLSY